MPCMVKVFSVCLLKESWEQKLSLSHTTRLGLIYVPTKNIKLPQTVRELWPTQDFGIMRDKYIVEKNKSEKDCLWKQRTHKNHENRRLDLIKLFQMQHYSLRGCIRTPTSSLPPPPPPAHPSTLSAGFSLFDF